MLAKYLTDLERVAKKNSIKCDIYNPNVSEVIINLYNIVHEYSEKKHRSTIPVPSTFAFPTPSKTRDTPIGGKFTFQNLDQSTVEEIVARSENLKITIETAEDGLVLELAKQGE
jgi:hypothetical protein